MDYLFYGNVNTERGVNTTTISLRINSEPNETINVMRYPLISLTVCRIAQCLLNTLWIMF